MFSPQTYLTLSKMHQLIRKTLESALRFCEIIDQDILPPLAGKKQLYAYETMDFWEHIKTPGKMQLLSTPWLGGNQQLGNGPASRLVPMCLSADALVHYPDLPPGDYSLFGALICTVKSVTAEDEVVVINSIVLLNKTLNLSVPNRVLCSMAFPLHFIFVALCFSSFVPRSECICIIVNNNIFAESNKWKQFFLGQKPNVIMSGHKLLSEVVSHKSYRRIVFFYNNFFSVLR